MTELERLLTQSLTTMEQELRDTQTRQGTMLEAQQATLQDCQTTLAGHCTTIEAQQNTLTQQSIHLNNQATTLHRLEQQTSSLATQQQEHAQHLQHLSELYTNLEGLLAKLNSLLQGR